MRHRPGLGSATLVVIAVLLSSATGLDNGFAYDDLVLIISNPSVHELREPLAYFRESYWGPERFNHLYRPLTILLFSVQWALGGGSPVPFHVVNVALHAVSALAVLVLARQIMAALPALFAALVFAVHPVHVEAIGNSVGQSEPLVAIALLFALALYVRDRRTGGLRPWSIAAIAALYFVALFVKEHAVLLPLLLLAAEFTLSPRLLPRRVPGDTVRIRTLLLLLALMLVIYLAIRLTVIGDLAGDSAHAALAGFDASERAWVMLGLLPEFARVLFWPARLYADYSPQLVSIHPTPDMAHVPGFLILFGWTAVMVFGWFRDRRIAFAAFWLPVTLALAANILVPTGVLLAERTLFLPSVGVAMGLGVLLAATWNSRPRALRFAVCMLLGLGAVRSATRQAAWQDNAAVISTMLADAPQLYRGHLQLGNMYAIHGGFEAAADPLRRAVELFPEEPSAQIELAHVLMALGRCEEAVQHFEPGIRLIPDSQRGRANWVSCLLGLQRLQDARLVALQGAISGNQIFHDLHRMADSLLFVTDSADGRNMFVRNGAKVDRSGSRRKAQESSSSDTARKPK